MNISCLNVGFPFPRRRDLGISAKALLPNRQVYIIVTAVFLPPVETPADAPKTRRPTGRT